MSTCSKKHLHYQLALTMHCLWATPPCFASSSAHIHLGMMAQRSQSSLCTQLWWVAAETNNYNLLYLFCVEETFLFAIIFWFSTFCCRFSLIVNGAVQMRFSWFFRLDLSFFSKLRDPESSAVALNASAGQCCTPKVELRGATHGSGQALISEASRRDGGKHVFTFSEDYGRWKGKGAGKAYCVRLITLMKVKRSPWKEGV